ncbi:hypothetical protein CEUSTIGMA_g12827.t1 [Chlamydomonas eustigma]|uniref:SAP domain-containing protein n=1 Tax=Chlamydomonas eustigma TaxID=1157962 RepID=A0A250XQQ6_9CHLO|nr:hypothetical protein CEUSTIGMA_g12827.t1 [Chlamydomonas eustigma]|eukprot:GAX85411.1 hypothetical protein CEUSTIGMA_g12827.t1 [Chlamydomonas eustigma]
MIVKKSLESLTVAQLKERLKGLGLSGTGLKAVLVERLYEALSVNQETVEDEKPSQPSADALAETVSVDQPQSDVPDVPHAETVVAPPSIEPITEQKTDPLTVEELLREDNEDDQEDLDHAQELEPAVAHEEVHVESSVPEISKPTGKSSHEVAQKDVVPGHAPSTGDEHTKRKRDAIQFHAPEKRDSQRSGSDVAIPSVNTADASGPSQRTLDRQQSREEIQGSLAKRLKVSSPLIPGTAISPKPTPPPATPTLRLYIDGLMRPFTEATLRELLSETGKVVDLWLPALKTHAVVTFDSEEGAEATRQALYLKKWPLGTKKVLQPRFISLEEAEKEKLSVSGNGATAQLGRGAQVMVSPKSGIPQPARAPGAGLAAAAAAAAAADVSVAAPRVPTTPRNGATDTNAVDSKDAAGDKEEVAEPTAVEEEENVLKLDDLFRKTTTKPFLYYLPLSEEQIVEKKKKAT